MSKAMQLVGIILLGVFTLVIIYLISDARSTNELDYYLLQEVTEASMYDAVDLSYYRKYGTVRIDREKFVENFVRRFAESVSLGSTYVIKIYDVNETPPKVSLEVSSKLNANVTSQTVEFDITNRIDAILETPY